MKEEMKDKIIIRGDRFVRRKIGVKNVTTNCYYILDLNYCDVSSSSISSTQTPKSKSGSALVVGSKLFLFGDPFVEDCSDGDDDDDDDDDDNAYDDEDEINRRECYTYVFDMTRPEQGWKRIKGDTCPLGVDFCDKIFLFRGSYFHCRCEVFDPQLNQWSLISSPPVHTDITYPVLADHKSNRIIVWFDTLSQLHAYYPNQDRWKLVAEEFKGWCPFSEQVTLADGVIYIFNQHCLMISAFDINTKQWFEGSLPLDSESYLHLRSNYKYESLLNRGNGLLCLLGYSYKHRHTPINIYTSEFLSDRISVVHAVEFKVNINVADKGIHLTWLSSKSFVLPDLVNIVHYLLV